MSATRTKHVRFLPWAFVANGLTVNVVSARYDFDRDAVVSPERHLVEADEPFEVLQLELEVSVPPETIAAVTGDGRKDGLAVALTWRCDETRWRAGRTLALETDRVKCALELRQRDVAGAVEVGAVLVRVGPSAAEGSRSHARLADARPWEVRIDRRRALSGNHLDIRYTRFSEDPVVPHSDKGNVYRLEVDGERPVLWLNADLTAAVSVLDAKAASGKMARLREVAFDLLTPAVWTQLFLKAAPVFVSGEGDEEGWQSAVVWQLAPHLYGKKATEVEVRRQLELDLDDVPSLLAKLDAVLQRVHELGRHLEAAAEDAS